MKKNGFKRCSVFMAATIVIASLLSCHPDGPQDFIDYYENPGKYEKSDGDDYAYSQNWSKPSEMRNGCGMEAERKQIHTS